jgi:hypothetical protein
MRAVKKLLKKLKDECEEIEIFIQSGERCCRQKGCVCKITDCFVVLFNKECKKIYIPFECICAISKLEEKKDHNEKDNKECDGKEARNNDKEQDDQDCWEVEENEASIEEEDCKEGELIPKVYGYGRKISLNFKEDEETIIIDRISMAELSVDLAADKEGNYLEYFYKSEIDDKSIGLSLLPANGGKLKELTCNDGEAIIKGRAVLYLDASKEGIVDFKLRIIEDKAKIKVETEEEELSLETEQLVGIGKQRPFIIEGKDN